MKLLSAIIFAGLFGGIPPNLDGITVYEKVKSRPLSIGSRNSHSREYVVTGTADQNAAINAILAALDIAPVYYTAVGPDGFEYRFTRDVATVEPIANAVPPTMWHGSLPYVLLQDSKEPYADGERATTFAIGSQNVHAKMAIAQIARYPASGAGAAPDFETVIGLTADREILGVDLKVPTFKFTQVVYKPNSEVTEAYINALYACAKSPVNDAEFLGFDAGEVLFIGVTGTRRSKKAGWELNFEFACEPNSTDAAPNSRISGIVKKGWEYLWFYFTPEEKSVGGLKYLVQIAKFAVVDKVYNTSNFAALEVVV